MHGIFLFPLGYWAQSGYFENQVPRGSKRFPLEYTLFQNEFGVQKNKKDVTDVVFYYETMPFQFYWKFYHKNIENFQKKILIFFISLLNT